MNRLNTRIIGLSLGVLALALVMVTALSGVTQTTPAAQAAPVAQATAVPPTATATAAPTKPAFDKGMGGKWAGASGEVTQYLMPVVTAVSTTLNLSPMELVAQLGADKSLADIAKAQNVELAKLKDAVTSAFKTQLEAAVKAGKVPQAQADKTTQTLNIWLDELLTAHKSSLPSNLGPQDFQAYATPVITAVANTLGLSPDQLKSELQAGKSLGEVAKAQKVELQKVKDAGLAAIQSQLNTAAKDGKFPQTWADKTYQTVVLWIDEAIK